MHAITTTSDIKRPNVLLYLGQRTLYLKMLCAPFEVIDAWTQNVQFESLTTGEPERAAKAREARRSGEFCKLHL